LREIIDNGGNKNHLAVPSPYLEQNFSDGYMGTKKTTRHDPLRCIRVQSYRKRLTDADGASAKAAIDGLVLAGILIDDSAEYVESVSYSQEKTTGEEYTVITIKDL